MFRKPVGTTVPVIYQSFAPEDTVMVATWDSLFGLAGFLGVFGMVFGTVGAVHTVCWSKRRPEVS